MDEIRQKLQQKFGKQKLPANILLNEIQQFIKKEQIDNVNLDDIYDAKLNEKMDVDTFIDYITVLKRNNYLNNCSVFQDSQDMDNDLDDACATVSDFIEDDKLQNRIDILNDVVQKYVVYEKKIAKKENKYKTVYSICIPLCCILLFWLFYPENDPY